jgi:rhodanese-related sulfurtransferase
MKKNLFVNRLGLGIIIILFTSIFSSAVAFVPNENSHIEEKNILTNDYQLVTGGYTNLTVEEVWELISNSSNGIQILIDVRTVGEYVGERIYTSSFLEKPRLFPLKIIERDGILLRLFMIRHQDSEVILYCRFGDRSFIATQILIDQGFSGTIYNMIGGIAEWKQAGLPVT